MNQCDWFQLGSVVVLSVATKQLLFRNRSVVAAIRKYWLLLLLFFATGVYFQFIIRVTQARSFDTLRFFVSGAFFAAIDSWISLLTIAVCTNIFFRKTTNRFLEIVFIFLISMLLFLAISMMGQIFMEVYLLNNDFYTYTYFADAFVKTSIHTFYALGFLSFVYFDNYRRSQNMLHEMKTALAETQLKLLHHQVDPHFLFNNLNVLSAFIPEENSKAHKYLTNLAGLYRYLLNSRGKDVVALEEEMEQAQKYAYLIQERFGDAYQFQFHYQKEHASDMMLPPLVVQELLVNAIKHNEAGTDAPLKIAVTVTGDAVEIKNNIQKRTASIDTPRTGIDHLNARYRLLTERSVSYTTTHDIFLIRLPLLKLISNT